MESELFAYRTYDELTALLDRLVAGYPHLARLSSIGESHRGRQIWLITITNFAAGADTGKPGYYIDANIHADETATTVAAVYTIWYVLTRYGSDPLVSHLLNTRALYVLPRVNPDGAEVTLTTPYHWVGNGRYLPGEETPGGLIPGDVDGDGAIVQMRVQDAQGEWKVSDRDPRIMLLRGPAEGGGTYYRIYPEGLIPEYDGLEVRLARPRDGNLNRQFPVKWQPDAVEYGAGPFPLSEPEARAVVDFVLDHPNIGGAQSYHTHGGVILRPGWTTPDSALPDEDLAVFQALGAVGTELTGYPVISAFHEFTAPGAYIRHGNLPEWLYLHRGIVAFTNEIWEPHRAAGVPRGGSYYPGYFPLVRTLTEEESLLFLAWNDATLGGEGFVDWHAFDHPQLGRVELGGWRHMFTFRNPPAGHGYLEALVPPNCLFTLHCAAALPLVRLAALDVTPLGPEAYRVRAVIENQGYLGTHVTRRAVDLGIARPVQATLLLPDGGSLVGGVPTQIVGHLAGRVQRRTLWSPWGQQWDPCRAAVEWTVRARSGTAVTVCVTSEKGGEHRVRMVLGAAQRISEGLQGGVGDGKRS